MTELFHEAMSAHNLPLTLLLVLAGVYWLLVMVGLLDFDLDLFDFGDDVSALPEAHDGPLSHLGASWLSAGRLLGFRDVPIVAWGSFLTLFLWAGAVVLNYNWNGEPGNRDLGRAALLFLPNLAGSLLLTRLVTWPMGRFFAAISNVDAEGVEVQGKTGIVVSMGADDTFGQVEVPGPAAPVLVNIRLTPGHAPLPKGARVRVLTAEADGAWHLAEAAPADAQA